MFGLHRTKYTVQLYREGIDPDNPNQVMILSSWEPITGLSHRKAELMREELIRDNRWRDGTCWPKVTVTPEEG